MSDIEGPRFPLTRMRRTRFSASRRRLVAETSLAVSDLVYPVFVLDGDDLAESVPSMPGIRRQSIDRLLEETAEAASLGIPAVVHEDGTGRLQTVTRQSNPWLHDLATHFEAITDVPIVINTSFNVMGKPIVHSVEDALAVLMTTGLDAILIEGILIEKTPDA